MVVFQLLFSLQHYLKGKKKSKESGIGNNFGKATVKSQIAHLWGVRPTLVIIGQEEARKKKKKFQTR